MRQSVSSLLFRPRAMAVVAMLAGGLLTGSPASAQPADTKITPGELFVEHPTLINLGFEWRVDGDANRNASVEVSYRKKGETAWKQAMPLVRLHGEQTYQRNVFNAVQPNMFAGSILDLTPGTEYEARFVMSDPDGINGPAANATKIVSVSTRPEPMPATGGKTYHVYPVKWKGPKQEPSFEGLMCAYNYYCGAGDTSPGGRPRVKPGDTILMHAGTYAYHYEFYANQTSINATTTFEGTYYLTASGTPEKPIVIKAAGDGEVILDGRDNFNLINVKAANYNYFEGITFRNTKIAIWAGTQFIAGSKGLTVKRCRFEDIGMGVFTNYAGSSDFYIADSVFIGRNDPNHLQGWNGQFWQQFADVDGQEFPPVMKSYTGIRLYGQGHVVAFNYVANFHDGIDTEMYGMPDGSHPIDGPTYPPKEFWDRRPVAIDIYNNYVTNAHDNSLEMDGSMHNIRVMRNMFINSASHPMSTQPSVGGPIYFIRNIIYNAPGGSTRLTAGSPGVIFYNNTILTETGGSASANVHWRNNLMLAQNAAPAVFTVNTNTNYSSSDYNGFRPNPGGNVAFQWNSPPFEVPMILADGSSAAKIVQRSYPTLQAYQQATQQDLHSVLLDYDVFVKVPKLDAKDVATVQRLYKAEDLDFRLKPGSAAVDKGVVLPN
ncbi:MAG: hypothetical protein LBQ09_03140, partial [Acidobacteriaceae bacterium]|nr:hypothetical protein [Acidobacteriaceae bacterium]